MTLLESLIDCQKFINIYLSRQTRDVDIQGVNKQSVNKQSVNKQATDCTIEENYIYIDNDSLKCEKNTITNYECGYCSRYIENPKHMYSDLPFCTLHCRNKQIKSDNMRYDVKNNNNFSF